jgi:ubiquinone/menaquinone biosynthesis C-methylase UbiE
MGWAESGQAWGERATDWAYLMEPYARRANDALFDRAGVGPGTRLLDIACGSGYAASVAAARGASVAGLDASEALIAIARARTPGGDFRVGDMFALPFDDDQFDVATSFNGIWKGCEDALAEARRVVRPGGLAGFSFWGSPKRLGLLPFFATLLGCRRPATSMPPSIRATPGGPAWPSRCSPTSAWSSWTGEPRRSSTNGPTST